MYDLLLGPIEAREGSYLHQLPHKVLGGAKYEYSLSAAYLIRRSNDIMVLPFDFSSILFVLARVRTMFSSFVYLSSSFTSLIRR